MSEEQEEISRRVLFRSGISQVAFEEIQCIVGRMPTIEELSTLMAMWNSNGRQQGLLTWLKGQPHSVEKNEYLYTNTDIEHKDIKEPRIKECLEIARSLFYEKAGSSPVSSKQEDQSEVVATPSQRLNLSNSEIFQDSRKEIHMVGNISTEFLNSGYANRYLHLVAHPLQTATNNDDRDYLQMILRVLQSSGTAQSVMEVATGGLFGTLIASAAPKHLGFDILSCREIRLDSFLFGEESGRFIVSLAEEQDDFFLLKMDEARVNCCFLGRTTNGRVLVDGMDFGPINDYSPHL